MKNATASKNVVKILDRGNICHSFVVTIVSTGVEKVFTKTSAYGVSLQFSKNFSCKCFVMQLLGTHIVSKNENLSTAGN